MDNRPNMFAISVYFLEADRIKYSFLSTYGFGLLVSETETKKWYRESRPHLSQDLNISGWNERTHSYAQVF